MAKSAAATADPAEVIEEFVDLSPEAQESKRNLEAAGPSIFDKGRIQAVVEEWRKRNPTVSNVADNRGMPVPMPAIVVTDKFVAELERQIIPIIQDCCDDSQSFIRRKIKAQRGLHNDGRAGVESLATSLAPPRGQLTIPPTPSR